MSYRGSLPPGQPYNNGQQPMPQPGYQQYGINRNAYRNSQHTNDGQFALPNQQMQPMPAYANDANGAPLHQPYNGGHNHYSHNAFPAPPAQYVAHQSYPQQMPPSIPLWQQISPPQPMPPLQPMSMPQHAQQPQPYEGTMNFAASHPQRRASDGPDHQHVAKKARKSMPAQAVSHSPTIPHATGHHLNTPSLLVCVADDCFNTAQTAVQNVAMSLDTNTMDEYYKLIATGLGCLDAALGLNKLAPRVEAKVRLRYASILSEETENLMEAETALTKGIAVCEKNRLMDLKYCMQFLLLKVLFRRNRKAALVAIDNQVSETMTYKQVAWVYAFRFLKASFHLQSGNPADVQALENLRSISNIANHRGDLAISVLASLLEGMTHLKARKDDMIVRVQTCIAQASKYQLDPSVHIPQIDVLIRLLDLACSLQQKAPQVAMQKLRVLQTRMDELIQTANQWDELSDELLLPFKNQSNSSSYISEDTRAILRPGPSECVFLVLSFATKVQAFILVYVFSGIALLFQPTKVDKSLEFWYEALQMLAKAHDKMRPTHSSLPLAIEQANWRAEVSCYIYILIALISASRTQWAKMKECMHKLEGLSSQSRDGSLDLSVLYITGVYHQGTADLDTAVRIFGDRRFAIQDFGAQSSAVGSSPSEVAILAALNRIWIMQEPSRRDDLQTMELIDQLRPWCANHANEDIRTAFNLVLAAIQTSPSASISQVKRHIIAGLNGSKATSNTQLLSIALNLMRSCLFENVVGEQTVKSARAGSSQAKKSGNLLWMSVGDGMLAQTCEMQGSMEEAQALYESGTRYANQAFSKPN